MSWVGKARRSGMLGSTCQEGETGKAREGVSEEEEEEEEEEGEEALPWRASFLVPVEADEERDADACRLCGEAGAALQCSGCRDAKYCGEVCQRIHWRTEHREMCRAGQGGNGGARAGASESESDAEGLDLDGLTLDV